MRTGITSRVPNESDVDIGREALLNRDYRTALSLLGSYRDATNRPVGYFGDSLRKEGGIVACLDPISYCYEKLGDRTAAKESRVRTAELLTSKGMRNHYSAGVLYDSLGMADEAIRHYELWLDDPWADGNPLAVRKTEERVEELKRRLCRNPMNKGQ